MRNIETCVSPTLLQHHSIEGKIVVVVDILRASSSIITALAHGVSRIIPVAHLDECIRYREQGFLVAAERNGQKQEGFDFGNSPFEFMSETLTGASMALTTTNGTASITKSVHAYKVVVGGFLNLMALARFVLLEDHDLMIVCAGWKGKVNLEDTLFAGALIDSLLKTHKFDSDASHLAWLAYRKVTDLYDYILEHSSHAQRLAGQKNQEDIRFCLTRDTYDIIPELSGKFLVKK